MSKTIWKYSITPDCTLDIPMGAKFLDVQTQHGSPVAWFLVNPNQITTKRVFKTYGTGHPVPENPGKFLGSFQLESGALVFHLFEDV